MEIKPWHVYSFTAFAFLGLWGFFSKVTADLVGPRTGVVLQIGGTIVVGIVILFMLDFEVEYDLKGIILSIFGGMFSIGGILLFLYALRYGQSVLVVPMTALYPVVTVVLGYLFLEEELNNLQMIGIALAIVASVLLSL